MVADPKARLKEIIDGYLDRDGGIGVDTGIVAGHLAQMKLFGIRKGVEFFPGQDNFGSQRKDYLDRVIKFNQLDTRLDSIWDYYLCDGQGLFYIRPTETNYRLYYFRRHEYRSYYNVDGELDEVVIIYSYKVKKGFGGAGGIPQFDINDMNALGDKNSTGGIASMSNANKRYIRLSIKRKTIEELHSPTELSFDTASQGAPGETKVFTNTLGFIPCVEIFNNAKGFSAEGFGEFDSLADQICTHDDLVRTMKNNIQFFGNPTLLSSRPKSDLMEAGPEGSQVQRPSIAANSGFRGAFPMSNSMFKADPIGRQSMGADGYMRVPRIIANLEPNDRVGYIVPDAITGDQNSFAAKFREEIRTALGGVDELSISAGVTATEYKSLYGRVAATSTKKAASVYTYGICRCLELILFQEEQLFRDSLARAAGIEKPLDLPEGATSDEFYAYNAAMEAYEDQVKAIMMACLETEQIPPGVQGLIPDGDITVQWRWMGPVYEDTTQDILNNSIVVRNLQELGVDSIEALKYLFPSKTDEERAEMLSGFPFRMVNELQGAYSQFAKLVGGMMSTPHPQSPDLPMAADPRLDMTPYLYRTLEALQREMSYAGRYRQLDPTDEPSTTSRRSEQLRGGASTGPGSSPGPVSGGDAVSPSSLGSSLQLPIDPVSILPPIPTGGPTGQPMGAGVQQGGGRPESSSPIPVPGATLSSSSVPDPGNYPGRLPVADGRTPSYAQLGSADMVAQPGLLRQLFPSLFANLPGGADFRG